MLTDFALLMLRDLTGLFYFGAGFRKAFHPEVKELWPQMAESLRLPPLLTAVLPWSQMLGGLALFIGFLTPLAAGGLALQMIGAVCLVCWDKVCKRYPSKRGSGFWVNLVMEPEIPLLAILVALTMQGAGTWSLDAVISAQF